MFLLLTRDFKKPYLHFRVFHPDDGIWIG